LIENDIHALTGIAIINEEPTVLDKVKEYLLRVNKLPQWDIYRLEWQQIMTLKNQNFVQVLDQTLTVSILGDQKEIALKIINWFKTNKMSATIA